MGNGPRLITAQAITVMFGGATIHYPNGPFTYAFNGDPYIYPFIHDKSAPDEFYGKYYGLLRTLVKLKVTDQADAQKLINSANKFVPVLWRTYMQNLLFNKRELHVKRQRQEKRKTYNPRDIARPSMKGKFR